MQVDYCLFEYGGSPAGNRRRRLKTKIYIIGSNFSILPASIQVISRGFPETKSFQERYPLLFEGPTRISSQKSPPGLPPNIASQKGLPEGRPNYLPCKIDFKQPAKSSNSKIGIRCRPPPLRILTPTPQSRPLMNFFSPPAWFAIFTGNLPE